MNTVAFMENVRRLRKASGMSQEELAAKLGVSAQAVSKWECGMSYPDIDMLLGLADFFGVTVDSLLRGEAETADALPNLGCDLPDDGKLRVVQFMGQRMLSVDDIDPENVIPLHIGSDGDTVNVEIWGSADIDGDVGGNVTVNATDIRRGILNIGNRGAVCNVSCGNVGGDIHTGAGNVTCGNVDSNVHTGAGNVKCGDVVGDVSTGAGNITCGDISGNARTSVGSIHCSGYGN